jgi:hypothetical protein
MARTRTRRTLNVPAGARLPFADELARANAWPPTKIRPRHRDGPPATPYLVVPADVNDAGARPLPGNEALHSAGIEFVTAAGSTVQIPKAGEEYSLRATIRNLGAAPSYAGVAEFALAYPSAIEAAAAGAGALPPHGIEGFVVQSDSFVPVTCRRTWKPLTSADAELSVVVQAYDLLLDPILRRFDARSDRHVGRRDSLPDFAGRWDGREFFAPVAGGAGLLYRVVVAQTDLTVDVSIFSQVSDIGGGRRTPMLPATPQLRGTGTIINREVQLSITEMLELNGPGTPPVPFTENLVALSLPDPDTLHVTTHRTFVAPGDPRGPQDLFADLTRA